jgi:hypothetical protein
MSDPVEVASSFVVRFRAPELRVVVPATLLDGLTTREASRLLTALALAIRYPHRKASGDAAIQGTDQV